MKILAIDTASEICSVALLEDTTLINHVYTNDSNTHSVNLMPLIDKLLTECNISINDIDLFACDKGPGSFTGIRIGISTLKAFCDVTLKPCIGISSLKSLAYLVNDSSNSYVCSLIDAKHGNVYAGIFYKDKNETYHKVSDYFFDNIQNAIEKLKNVNKKIFFVGNASILYKDMIESELNNSTDFITINSSAITIGIAAFYKWKLNYSLPLTPLYLKKSSAEILLEEKSKNESRNI